jgi:hypothetical protein
MVYDKTKITAVSLECIQPSPRPYAILHFTLIQCSLLSILKRSGRIDKRSTLFCQGGLGRVSHDKTEDHQHGEQVRQCSVYYDYQAPQTKSECIHAS